MGHTWIRPDGFGLPQRFRAAAHTALTGFQSAMVCIQLGMWSVGTMALETNVKGNSTMKPKDAADSGLFEFIPTMAVIQVIEYEKKSTSRNPATMLG